MKYFLASLMFAISSNVIAQSDVYLCTSENGNKEYKNTGTAKGCIKVELPGLTTNAPKHKKEAGNQPPDLQPISDQVAASDT